MSGVMVVITPDGRSVRHLWNKKGPPDYTTITKHIGGYMERVKVRYEGKIRDMWCDEEGLIKQLSLNHVATQLTQGAHMIVGTVVIWCPGAQL